MTVAQLDLTSGECRGQQSPQLLQVRSEPGGGEVGAGDLGTGERRVCEAAGSMAAAAGGWGSAVPPLSLLRPLHTVGSGGGAAERVASRHMPQPSSVVKRTRQ